MVATGGVGLNGIAAIHPGPLMVATGGVGLNGIATFTTGKPVPKIATISGPWTSSSISNTIPVPTGTANGDVLLFFLMGAQNDSGYGISGTWTALATEGMPDAAHQIQASIRTWHTGDTTTYTISNNQLGTYTAIIMRITGAVLPGFGPGIATATSTSVNVLAITTTVVNCLVVAMCGHFAGFTIDGHWSSAIAFGSSPTGRVVTQAQPATGPTPNTTIGTLNTAAGWSTIAVSLPPI
jgi:hypothetical protein